MKKVLPQTTHEDETINRLMNGLAEASEIPGILEAISDRYEPEEVASIATLLLQKELETLEWPPLSGAEVVLKALELAIPIEDLLSTSCTYLSLYFQELDDVLAKCRSLVNQGADSLFFARDLLVQRLESLEGVAK